MQKTDQVYYDGRWVSKENFRVFVYNEAGMQKLVNSYDEYEKALATGIWYAQKDKIDRRVKRERKPKDDSSGAVS